MSEQKPSTMIPEPCPMHCATCDTRTQCLAPEQELKQEPEIKACPKCENECVFEIVQPGISQLVCQNKDCDYHLLRLHGKSQGTETLHNSLPRSAEHAAGVRIDSRHTPVPSLQPLLFTWPADKQSKPFVGYYKADSLKTECATWRHLDGHPCGRPLTYAYINLPQPEEKP